MLDYCKTILEKVSFDSNLFEKELRKAMTYIQPHEIKELLHWAHQNLGPNIVEVINKIHKFL